MASLLLSQYVVSGNVNDLLADDPRGIGYLLKDRIADVGDFLRAVDDLGAGGTVLDPEVIRQLVGGSRHRLDSLTNRERDVLAAMAQGGSNSSIASTLHISEGSVEKHVASIFSKLDPGQRPADTPANPRRSRLPPVLGNISTTVLVHPRWTGIDETQCPIGRSGG